MTLVILTVGLLGLAIAYVNGANDVSKGIATLVGSGVTDLRRAVLWGTIWTGIGGTAGALLARAMVQTFGKGLLASSAHPTTAAAVASIAGAAAWVGLATRKGLPVSTTHAIVGSVVGVASLAYGLPGVNWAALTGKIVLPLLLSPLVSLTLSVIVMRALKAFAPARLKDCICVELVPGPVLITADGVNLGASSIPAIHTSTCASARRSGLGITLSHLHWLTSGATSFARGLNDAPKMVALVLAAAVLAGPWLNKPPVFFAAITVGMVAGSWIAGRRVTKILATGVTRMNDREGFVANFVTAALVGPGAALGLPMSTTHVASGAIMGLAAGDGKGVNWKTIRDMLLAWIVTLPVAALLGIAALETLRWMGIR
jgi:inorganic phosphate transporter, PiT family